MTKADRDFLTQYGNTPVKKITVCRTPILGNSNAKPDDFDKHVNVFMLIELSVGITAIAQKIGRVHINEYVDPLEIKNQKEVIGSISTTINAMMDLCIAEMGRHAFFKYTAFDLNNTDFIINMLGNSLLLSPLMLEFIRRGEQDVKGGALVDYVRKDFSPDDKKVLEQYGSKEITRLVVCRTPISKYINFIVKALSLGKFHDESKKANGSDTIYHLYMLIYTAGSAQPLLFEKNETVRLTTKIPELTDKSQTMDVPNVESKHETLKQFIDNGIKLMGDDFWKYKWDSLNCQYQINKCLEASGLLTPELKKFILQDIGEAKKTLPSFFKRGFQAITDVAGIGRRLFGKGLQEGQTVEDVGLV